jgi:pimeloyl-ACP methyl ester carboxylesterase
VTSQSLRRIGEYVSKAPPFASLDEAEAYLRVVAAPFGALTDEQWRHLTVHSVRPAEGGGYRMAYDPGIAVPYLASVSDEDIDLWPIYDAIRCPTLVVRGADSDLLSHATASEMTRRGPAARLAEIAGVGHAPMMLDGYQIGIVRDFLDVP